MVTDFTEQIKSDFSRARFKAFINRIRNTLRDQPKTLISYDDVKEKLRIGGPVYRGVQVVEIKKIVGSLNRYHQFDRTFLPLEDKSSNRWQNIDRAFYQEVNLPPVLLYKIGEIYFVVDGHNRVSVAREKGQTYIDAEVRECQSKVHVTADIKLEDLEILGEKVMFFERTGLDRLHPKTRLESTIPGGYDRMLEHIAVHRYFMGLDEQRDISEQEAVSHWYKFVYLPIIQAIKRSNILREFPGKTKTDLYLWILDRQRYLSQEGQRLSTPRKAAEDYLKDVKP